MVERSAYIRETAARFRNRVLVKISRVLQKCYICTPNIHPMKLIWILSFSLALIACESQDEKISKAQSRVNAAMSQLQHAQETYQKAATLAQSPGMDSEWSTKAAANATRAKAAVETAQREVELATEQLKAATSK